ncbi:MAG: hypothetical protein J5365_06330 [Erysipelotrichaceae bacterium]|nr:hypothetical protein [Erysipelotrichaceae bacterium]
MKIDEKKLVEYLETHIGENTTTFRLAKECSLTQDDEMDFKEDELIRRIAEENGYKLNADYHAYEELGMPWVIDFYIEIADVEKNMEWINSGLQSRMKAELIEQEYGIYNNWERLVGFRLSIPWQIKKMYDEICNELEENEKAGILND